jgi:hypothetical protein
MDVPCSGDLRRPEFLPVASISSTLPPYTEGSRVVSGQRVVVVDGLAETEQVLKAVLEPRGLRVERIRAHASHTSDREKSAPNVLVLHSDDAQAKRRSWDGIPCVVIGSAAIPESGRLRPDAHYLQKPFCYRELICAIEQLLADTEP